MVWDLNATLSTIERFERSNIESHYFTVHVPDPSDYVALKSDISCVAVAAALDLKHEPAGSLSLKYSTGVLLHSKSYW